MADTATAPAADATQGKQQVVKPEKPDEEKYATDLAKAEKEHAAAQEKLVSDTIAISSLVAHRILGLPAGNLHRKHTLR